MGNSHIPTTPLVNSVVSVLFQSSAVMDSPGAPLSGKNNALRALGTLQTFSVP